MLGQHRARPYAARAERLEHGDQAVVSLPLEIAERAAVGLGVGLRGDPVERARR